MKLTPAKKRRYKFVQEIFHTLIQKNNVHNKNVKSLVILSYVKYIAEVLHFTQKY